MRSRLGTLLPFLGLVTSVTIGVVGPGCKAKAVSIEVTVPSDVQADTVWLELGAYRDASCKAVSPMLGNGVPEGATARVAFERDKSPTFGELDRGSYAFAAVARAQNCGVLATGCVEVDVSKSSAISISMRATESPTGACEKGSVCSAARCVPASDNKNPTVGAECSLELLGAGPLAQSLGSETMLSAPAIAATPSGFVIAYREVDSTGSKPRVTVLPVDSAGGALSPGTKGLKNRCGDDETDGVGLVMNGAEGQLVVSRSKCGGRAALELLSFSSKPDVTINGTFVASESLGVQRFFVSNAHVSARNGNTNVVTYVEDGSAKVSAIRAGTGGLVSVDLNGGTFGGTTGMTGAWVASSDKVLALLAAGPPGVAEPSGDAGAEGGGGGGGGGDTTPQLNLVMVPPGTAVALFNATAQTPRPAITFPGAWGAVAALGTRVIVVSDGGGSVRSVTYRTFDLDRAPTADSNGFSVEGPGTVTNADITMLDDKAYIAALKPGAISLNVFSKATVSPLPLREVIFSKLPRIPSVSLVRDGRVAVAATPNRVMVAWTTAKVLTANDATGGYAVFACTP